MQPIRDDESPLRLNDPFLNGAIVAEKVHVFAISKEMEATGDSDKRRAFGLLCMSMSSHRWIVFSAEYWHGGCKERERDVSSWWDGAGRGVDTVGSCR